jgi:hypothetical protein
VPPAVISKHSERVRKREERRRDREAATARQAAADAELREQQEAEDFKLLDALLTACNGNYSRTAALADPRPIHVMLNSGVPIEEIISTIKCKVDRRAYPRTRPSVRGRSRGS